VFVTEVVAVDTDVVVVVAVVVAVVVDTDVVVSDVVKVVVFASEPARRPIPTKAPPELAVLGLDPALIDRTSIELPSLSLPIEGPVGIGEPTFNLYSDLPVSLSRKAKYESYDIMTIPPVTGLCVPLIRRSGPGNGPHVHLTLPVRASCA